MIGVERLAQFTAKISKFANALKQGVLSIVKVGRKLKTGMPLGGSVITQMRNGKNGVIAIIGRDI